MTLYNNLATPFVAGFNGAQKMNFFNGEPAAKEMVKPRRSRAGT
ncbi:ABC-type sugar transport system ATPase subunit [Rhizobium sp. BK181]|nr:ABC-type sugar transport system ATPase subunit [Rhizobium sp. BK181]